MGIFSTSGVKGGTPISKEDVVELLTVKMITAYMAKCGGKPLDAEKTIESIIQAVKEIPTMQMPDGKRLARRYYPRVMVTDSMDETHIKVQVGCNFHHELIVNHGKNRSWLSFVNSQGMVGTDFADEGYKFVGEKPFAEYGDDTELVPFDEVWVEEEENGQQDED